MTLERSPLDAVHRARGARLVPFGGWEMPLEYPTGTIAEHHACRTDAVVFDVSHLGSVRVDGAMAFDTLQLQLTNDLAKIGPGRAQYTHLLDPDDGSVLDDIIVWWHPTGDDGTALFDVMPNASNTDRVVAAVGGVETTHGRVVLAVQGPRAKDRLEQCGRRPRPSAGSGSPTRPGTAHPAPSPAPATPARPAWRSPCPSTAASQLWEAIVAAGVQPAGLGARDTLRLEAGLPLHGHELGPGITPLQAGLGWVVGWVKPDFRGRDALAAERARGVDRHLVGLTVEGRRPPRAECPILVDGNVVGTVTSGNFSPTLGHGIALGFVPPHITIGASVDIDVRGTAIPATVVATPFVGH